MKRLLYPMLMVVGLLGSFSAPAHAAFGSCAGKTALNDSWCCERAKYGCDTALHGPGMSYDRCKQVMAVRGRERVADLVCGRYYGGARPAVVRPAGLR